MKIIYDSEDLELKIIKGATLLEMGTKSRVPIPHVCGGMASCGTCRVVILEGLDDLHPRNELEQSMADDRGYRNDERLACQIHPCKNLRFKMPFE